MSGPSPSSRAVVLLESDPDDGRRLQQQIEATGFAVRIVETLDQFRQILGSAPGLIGVVSFEALWPQPQEKLKALRESAPGARLVVVHADNSPRMRLGQRLWSAGALDYFVSRSLSVDELGQVLRQAQAELVRAAAKPSEARAPRLTEPGDRLRFLHTLSAALSNQRTVAGLLRELHIRLPALVPYVALQVYLPAGSGFWVRQFQDRPLGHQSLQALIERTSEVLAGLMDRPVALESISVEDGAPVPNALAMTEINPEALHPVVVPMTSAQGLVGCLSLLVHGSSAQIAQAAELVEMVSFQFAASLTQAQLLEDAERESLVDPLTGCHNRRFLNQLLDSEWKRSVRYKLSLSLAVINIDQLTHLNDVYGHSVGDQALQTLATFIRSQLRETDSLARYEGAHFALVLPETGPAEAVMVLERVRLLALNQAILRTESHGPIQVSFSAGVAGYPASPVESPDSLIREASAALAAAKASGGDRIRAATVYENQPLDDGVAAAVKGSELRTSPRVESKMNIRYLEVPDFASSLARVTSADISAGGLSVVSATSHLKKNSYGLVFLEDSQKPMLTRVVWITEEPGIGQRAGLRFVETSELDLLAHGDRERKEVLKALVIAENVDIRNMVGRVLHAAQYEITFLDDSQAWPKERALSDFGVIVVGDSALRGHSGNRLLELQNVPEKVRIVVINESSDRRQALDTLLSHQVRHMVSAEEASDEALFATLNKLLLGEYFGIRKYLMWGVQSKSWSVSHGESKAAVLDGVRAIAAEVRCHPRVADLFLMAVDEMIINALYRAPPSEGALARPVSVECGSDGRLLVVSVLDEHGRFKPQDLYGGLGRSLEQQGIPGDAQHANMGFRIMLDALSQLAINVEPGKCTEIIGIVDLRKSLKQYRSSVPTFNMFSKS